MNFQFVITILLFASVAQGLLLSLALLFIKRGNTSANRILAVLLFIFTLMIFFHASEQMQPQSVTKEGEEKYGHTIFFLFGPLFYYYGKALTSPKFRFHIHDVMHFLPFTLFVALYFIVERLPYMLSHTQVLHRVISWCMMVQMLAYLLGVLRILRNHNRRIREKYSSLEKITLRWLYVLMIAQVVIWPAAFVVEMTKKSPQEMNVMWILISLFMYMIGYFDLRQPEIFTGMSQEEVAMPSNIKKYTDELLFR